MKNLYCACDCCKEKPQKSKPRYLLRNPARKRMSPQEVFFWTVLFFIALFFTGHFFWT